MCSEVKISVSKNTLPLKNLGLLQGKTKFNQITIYMHLTISHVVGKMENIKAPGHNLLGNMVTGRITTIALEFSCLNIF